MDNTTLDLNLDGIPSALAEREQWVLWEYIDRDGRKTKMPKQANGSPADSSDPSTWTDLDRVIQAYRTGGYAGIGFVLTEEDWFVFIDLDDCVVDGALTGPAQRICDAFDTFAEWSPSGTGAHIIAAGMKPTTDCKALDVPGMKELEIYEAGRYMTMTGQRLDGHPKEIRPCREEIVDLCDWAFGEDDPDPERPTSTPDRELSETEIWDLIEKADDQKILDLWQGDTSYHDHDHSRADLSLCCKLRWYGADRQQIDSLFRTSGLMRPKWDAQRGNQTYGQMTIDEALDRVDDLHPALTDDSNLSGDGAMGNPPEFVPPRGVEGKPPDGDDSEQDVRWSDLDVQTAREITESDLDPLRPVVKYDGRTILPEGITLLASRPKIGKTMWAQNVAVGVAKGGVVLSNATVHEQHQGDVLYINPDGSKRGSKSRLQTMCPDEDGGAPENLHMVHGGFPEGQNARTLLDEWCEKRGETSLIVVDTLQHLRPTEDGRRNQYHSDYDFLFPIAEIARRHNVSMLLIHHLNKMQSGDELDKVSGSTGLTGAVENVLLLDRARGEDHASLAVRPREEPEDTFDLKFDPRVLTWQVGFQDHPEPGTAARAKVWNVLVEADGPVPLKEIADAVGTSRATVSEHLDNLRTTDEMPMARTDDGRYEAKL